MSVAVQSLLGLEKFVIKVDFVGLRRDRGLLSRYSFYVDELQIP